MTTEELIEELKKHPGKKVASWDGVSYRTVVTVEVVMMEEGEDDSWESHQPFFQGEGEEVVVL